jgi:hypothetical protein
MKIGSVTTSNVASTHKNYANACGGYK